MAVADHRVIFNRYGQEVLRESYLDELGPVLEASMVLPLDNCVKPPDCIEKIVVRWPLCI
jgi:hypothetical protein